MSNEMRHMYHGNVLQMRVSETPTSQERVLGLLLDEAGSQLTEAQVRERLLLPKSTTSRALSELVDDGLVVDASVGRTRLYAVDPSDPVVRHLKIARTLLKTREALKPVVTVVDSAVLFGSASKGEDGASSDVDILVVTMDTETVEAELSRHGWMQSLVVTPSRHMALIAEGGTLARALAEGIEVVKRR